MKRTTWVKPMTLVQQFEANEPVAATACWGVGCDTVAANSGWDDTHPQYHPNNPAQITHAYYPYHDPGSCGVVSHQFLKDIDGDGSPDKMYELKDGEELECTVFSDANYSNQIGVDSIMPGQTIYWTTVASTGRLWLWPTEATWHHVGTVEATYPGHPLRS